MLSMKRWLIGVALLLVLAVIGNGQLISMVWWNLGYVDLAHLTDAVEPGGMAVRYAPPTLDTSGLAQRAEARFREAIRWWPSGIPARLGLGEALIRQGRYDEAATILQGAVEDGGLGWGGFAAGTAHMFAGLHQDGLDLWMATASDPLTRLRLAIVVFGQSDWQHYHPERWLDAIRILEDTVQTQPVSPTVAKMLYVQLAEWYWQVGDIEHAVGTLSQIVTFDPRDGRARSTLAWIFMTKNRDEEAFSQADLAIETDPNWRAFYVRGTIALRQCRTRQAIADFRAGLTYPADEYRFAYQFLGLGSAYWETGQVVEAFEQWNIYRQLQPRDSSIKEMMIRAEQNTLERHCAGHTDQ